jgi:LmbE family N-acetylglucosaminyl deacetylase
VAREIRRHKPDAIFTIDPGEKVMQWHKSDHRAAAILTADAMRAAGWRLYFPELEAEGFKHWVTPVCYFYYTESPNYEVDITDLAQLKLEASAAHISQFGPMVDRYDPNPTEAYKSMLKGPLFASMILFPRSGDRIVERFRRATGYGQ